MSKIERTRELVSSPPDERHIREKAAAGWRLVSLEWEREVPSDSRDGLDLEIPYGLEVASNCRGLAENAIEKQALLRMMELIVQDRPLSEVAYELNRGGYRTRQGAPWNEAVLFDLLPRLIEAGPKILTDADYVARKARIPASPQ